MFGNGPLRGNDRLVNSVHNVLTLVLRVTAERLFIRAMAYPEAY